jgi:hypothetical protein
VAGSDEPVRTAESKLLRPQALHKAFGHMYARPSLGRNVDVGPEAGEVDNDPFLSPAGENYDCRLVVWVLLAVGNVWRHEFVIARSGVDPLLFAAVEEHKDGVA